MTASKRPLSMPRSGDWRDDYRAAVITPEDLLHRLELKPDDLPFAIDSQSPFPLKAPPHFVSLMEKGNPNDPLLLQVLSRLIERERATGFVGDPVEEAGKFRSTGLLQKYAGRALLITTGACAIHCRYCFRRHYEYDENQATSTRALSAAFEVLKRDETVRELILSGGDPLSLSDDRIEEIFSRAADLAHLDVIRIHTRTLTTVPSRVTAKLLDIIRASTKHTVVVTHTNHPKEIDDIVKHSLGAMKSAGAVLLNQAVLLRGVNDDSSVLEQHCWRLFDAGVAPYYVHLLDPVDGGSHFDVPANIAATLEAALRKKLPGYLMPRFVKETPGAPFKTPLESVANR
ncbi:MAG: EF-P beta-lysylation protein EpmB [Parvularculaceae bacterium]|nr:EF-P beta-lysylation protein EpmB [Parvularculaceae bacterium]